MPSRSIGIFDSGEGGLTVAREIVRHMPGENLIYVCDTARFPYGPRPLSQVRGFLRDFTRFFADQDCKLVVVACNTATVAALDLLDDGLALPAIGVVGPGARAAATATRNGRIGVVATQATCASRIYPRLIAGLRPAVTVRQQPCPVLVIRAEEGVIDGPQVREDVRRCLAPLLAEDIDTLVLGCTHFPHMQHVIAEIAGPGVTLVDPGVATGREVARRLAASAQANPSGDTGRRSFYTTGDPQRFIRVASRLWPGVVKTAERIPLVV